MEVEAAVPPPPRKCPKCGYLLQGLPAVGRCPECGWEYDGRVLVLHGQPAGRALKGPALATSPSRWFWATLLLSATMFAALWLVAELAVGTLAGCTLGIFGTLAFYGARRIDARRERTQLVLTPGGWHVRDGPGEGKRRGWGDDVTASVAASWQSEPTPGWLAVRLTRRTPRRRRWQRWIGIDASGESEGVELPLAREPAAAALATLEQWLDDAGRTLTLPFPTRVELGLLDASLAAAADVGEAGGGDESADVPAAATPRPAQDAAPPATPSPDDAGDEGALPADERAGPAAGRE